MTDWSRSFGLLQVMLPLIAVLSLISGICSAYVASRLNNYDDYAGGVVSAGWWIFMAFTGIWTFLWSLAIFALYLVSSKRYRPQGGLRWIVGPAAMTVQLALLWLLWIVASSGISNRRAAVCRNSRRFVRFWDRSSSCAEANTAVTFSWLSWFLLTLMVPAALIMALKMSRDEGGLASTGSASRPVATNPTPVVAPGVSYPKAGEGMPGQPAFPQPRPATPAQAQAPVQAPVSHA